VLLGASSPADIWGYTADQKQMALLGHGASSSGIVSRLAMPLSALFTLTAPRSQILTKAGISQDTPSFIGFLPPLFKVQETNQLGNE
jgi:hypothetical protein